MPWEWDGTLERIHHALYAATREREAREARPSPAIIDSQIALFGRVVELAVSGSRAHSSVTLRFHRVCQVVVSTAWAGFPTPRGSCGSPGAAKLMARWRRFAKWVSSSPRGSSLGFVKRVFGPPP